MVLPYGEGDIYHKYRPRKFSEVAGHEDIIKSLKNALISEHPSQSFLLTGASGTGKTTSARIMALSLNCADRSEDGEPCLKCKPCTIISSQRCMDIIEKNAAEHRGIDAVREISKSMSLMPMQVKNKVYILDEFHQMTKEAQTSLLKVLEEAPRNVFIILCTTHPEKILPTVKNRCQQFTFKSLRKSQIANLIEEVTAYEGRVIAKEIVSAIAESAEGSPRKALVTLQQVFQLDEVTPLSISNIVNTETEDPGIMKLCFAVGNKTWPEVMSVYKEVKTSGAPAIGMIMAGFIRNQLIGCTDKLKAKSLSSKLDLFLVPFAESKLGENQLVNSLYKCHMYGSGRF
jgi:DNA polymerase-3 subunit gamma/tau